MAVVEKEELKDQIRKGGKRIMEITLGTLVIAPCDFYKRHLLGTIVGWSNVKYVVRFAGRGEFQVKPEDLIPLCQTTDDDQRKSLERIIAENIPEVIVGLFTIYQPGFLKDEDKLERDARKAFKKHLPEMIKRLQRALKSGS